MIVDNNIHDNNGTGIAMRYRENQPSFNGLIQNNRIVNNTRYPIYLEKAQWFEINGNLMEGNGAGDEVYLADHTSDIIQREGAQYQEDYTAYLALVPSANIECLSGDRFETGKEVVFTASGSTDPNGKPLTFRWEMGDGTVLAGETVRYTFKEPGFYDVAITATNGDWTDTAWLSVNVVAAGEEIGTESLDNWEVTENNGKTSISLQKPDMEIPSVGGTDWVDHPIYYVVDGDNSIKMASTSQESTLTYPASRDAGLDLSNEYAFGFSMKVRNQNTRNGANSPVVTLYTDENNYMTFTPSDPLMFPHAYETFTEMQYRHEWYPVNIPLEGGAGWLREVSGTPDLSNINYVSIRTQSGGTQPLELWIDGMKTISKDRLPYYGANIAADGQEVYSSAAEDSAAGINQQVNMENRWTSQVEKESVYGVTFDVPRSIDQVNFYTYYKPIGLEGDVIGLPESCEVQYLSGGQWLPVSGMENGIGVMPNENRVSFDMVYTTGIRVVLKNADGAAASLYGFEAVNSWNYAAKQGTEGKPAVEVESSIRSDVTVNSIDMFICVANEELFPEIYSDFLVFIYEVSADGRGPQNTPIGKGVLPIEEIVEGGLNKPYNIQITDMDGNELVLKAGSTYVVGATQEKCLYPNNKCYRWPTSQHPDGTEEHFGKYEPNVEGVTNGFGEEKLGTGWLRIYTDKDVNSEPLIDYSYELSHSTGFGVGCESGEVGRYQTFTLPADTANITVDGKVQAEEGWETRGAGETDYLRYQLVEKSLINNALLFLDGVPEMVRILSGETVLAEKNADTLVNGENRFSFEAVETDTITVEIINNDSSITVREVELLGQELPAVTVDKTALEQAIADAVQYNEDDYTKISWAAFADALAKANQVNENTEATQEEVDAAVKALNDAAAGLEEYVAPNKSLLQKTYDYALTLSTEGVTDSAKKFFEDATAAAKAVLDDAKATQEEVNTAWDNLLEGIWGLGLVQGDKTMLEQLIAKADEMMANADKYVQDNWQQLVDALAKAKEVMADGDAMESDVQPAAEALLNAILAQRYKANKSILNDLIQKAEGIDLDGYTMESVMVFMAAFQNAKMVMADETLSENDQAVVDEAVSRLEAAIENLSADTSEDDKDKETDKPDNETPSTDTSSEDKPSPDDNDANSPATGESSTLIWIAVMGAVAAGWVFMRKKADWSRKTF